MNARPYECCSVTPAMLTRRDLLRTASAGFGWLAFKSLTTTASAAENLHPLAPKAPHFPPRAKRVIFLCMQGGPSPLDPFDYKPKLTEDSGKPGPSKGGGAKLYGSPFKFEQRGQSGLWISELFPKVAEHADDLCVLSGMHTDIPNHPQAFVQLHTGSSQFVRPSLGAWALYGLGTANENLPGFVTISPPQNNGGSANYAASFLPASYQGTRIGRGNFGGGEQVSNLRNPRRTLYAQRVQL